MLGEDLATMLARILNQMTHSMGLVHLLSAAGVITGVTRIDGLSLMNLEVMFLDFTYSSFDSFLTYLTLPQLTRSSTYEHFVDQSILVLTYVPLKLDPF